MRLIVKSSKNDEIRNIRKAIKMYKKAGNTEMVLRLKVIIAHLNGQSDNVIASCFDVSLKTVKRWLGKYKDGNIDDLSPGHSSGRPPKIDDEKLEELRKLIEKDNQRVWVSRHVCSLLMIVFNVVYSVKYVPELLKKINLSFHKAVHYLIKRNEEKRSEWITKTLPEIYSDHINNGWRIYYQDEVGFQTEGTLSYTWSPKGKEIAINNMGRHGRVNLMGVYELGSGDFFYKLTNFKVTALRFKRFLCCLKKKYKNDKFIIIADNASFHKAKWFSEWVKNQPWLQLKFLPAYSPDFNPIERLWKWIKKEYTHNKCWSSKIELYNYLQSCLTKMTSSISEYIGTMKEEILKLKKAFEFYKTPFIWEEQLLGTT